MKILRYAIYIAVVIVIVISAAMVYVSVALPQVDDVPDLKVETTPEKVARGKYLAHHVMLCADCHSKRDFSLFAGPPTPGTEFAGGEVFDQSMGFPGRFISPNITPAGIGDWTDGELFRLITTGVNRDGDPIFPVMPYQNYGKMDADDIEAVIAYLRTLDPIQTNHPSSEVDFPFNLIMRTIPTKAEFCEKPASDNAVAYGAYVFTAAACGDCHTKFEDGSFVGPFAGGGREFAFPDGSIVRTANLTPHPTGLGRFTKDSFIQLFKSYADSSYTPAPIRPGNFQTMMPWTMYAEMSTDDLGAIYDYLMTLEPYDNPVERFTAGNHSTPRP